MELPLLTKFLEDHKRIAAVCDVIGDNIAGIEAGNDASAAMVRLALEYIRDYPEWHHHPREEYLFCLAQKADPSLERAFEVARSEHDSMPGDTQAILAFLERPRDQAMNRRVATALRSYIAEHKQHMRHEEQSIYPRLRKLLPVFAWELPATTDSLIDPLAGNAAPGHFQPLRDALFQAHSA